MSPDIGIVKARLGFRRHQIAINRKWDIEIAENSAVIEFDFENVTAFAVANLCDRGRLDRLPWDPRSDVVRCRCRLCPR